MRQFPEVLTFEEATTEDDAATALVRHIDGLGFEAPLVLASAHGAALARVLHGPDPPDPGLQQADQTWALEVGSSALSAGADSIVAIGGGRRLDVAKLAAARAGLPMVSVPTQLSHDGICSPVAVVPDATGRTESIGAVAPVAVFVSLPTLVRAPAASLRAGLGDLVANPLSLKDWALSAERGLDQIDERAWDLSVQSFELVKDVFETGIPETPGDAELYLRVAQALILSGTAMICAGTSRPASGGEHEISHAIDELYGGRSLHGAQVAFGAIVSVALYDDDTVAFRAQLRRAGLPDHPAELGLTEDDLVDVLLHAPNTRPGRFTVIEEANLDDAAARALVKRIWGEDQSHPR